MRIDLPCCGFKNCRYCFDGNCTKPSKLEKCEYWYLLHEESESAGPDLQPTCNNLATDTISRQAAINAPVKMVSEGLEWIPVYHIKELPPAEPEIIRCRDCKHHDGIRCFRWNSTIITGFDDYCSNAERRGESDE